MRTKTFSVALAAVGLVLALGASRPAFATGSTSCHNAAGQVIPCPIRCEECLWLDTYSPTDPPVGTTDNDPASIINTALTAGSLDSGVAYRVTITGTYSAWATPPWPAGWPLPAMFSQAEKQPFFPSLAGIKTGPVGLDWEYLFCSGFSGNASPVVHIPQDGFSLDGGVTYQDHDPDGCPGTLPACYTTTHQYHYTVVGQGQKMGFLKKDTGPHSDNYGMFRICIQRLSPCGDSGCDKCGTPGTHCPGM